jgi:hypothetical protein
VHERKRKRQKKKITVQREKVKVAWGFAAMGADGLAKLLGVIKSINNR